MEKIQTKFNLEEVSLITKVINRPDCLIVDEETGEVFDKDVDIESFAIIYDCKPKKYMDAIMELKEEKHKRKSKKSNNSLEDQAIEDIKAEDEEIALARGEERVRMSDAQIHSLIAKELKIRTISTAMLMADGWYMVPIFNTQKNRKPMTVFRPVIWQEIKNGYRLVIKSQPLFTLDESPFTDKVNWQYNSVPFINDALGNDGDGLRFSAIVPFRHQRNKSEDRELKMALKSFENAQKTRIKVGNNIITSLYTSKGNIMFNELKESVAKDGKSEDVKVLPLIEAEYLQLNQEVEAAVFDSHKQAAKIMKELNAVDDDLKENKLEELLTANKRKRRYNTRLRNEAQFRKIKEEMDLKFISSYCVYNQIREYLNYKTIEDESKAYLFDLVHHHPLWTKYLVGIRGCGETMAAYIIANYNIYITEHPSEFLRYTGLDQVTVKPEEDHVPTTEEKIRALSLVRLDCLRVHSRIISAGETNESVAAPGKYRPFTTDILKRYDQYIAAAEMVEEYNLDAASMIPNKVDGILKKNYAKIIKDKEIKATVSYILENMTLYDITNENGINVPTINKVARTKRTKETATYLDKNGNIQTKSYLGYNAVLKGKLLGVLFEGFLKQIKRGSGYAQMYMNFKERLMSRPDLAVDLEKNKGHIHAMARRKTMQEFVKDLWINWRKIEGLPLNGGTYEEAKLGIMHKQGLRPDLIKSSANITMW